MSLAPQFDDPDQQFDAAVLGMWGFLATEVLFFGALFLAYLVYRSLYPLGFAEGSLHLNADYGAINTAVLLLSSLTMALAVNAAQTGRQGALVGLLLGMSRWGRFEPRYYTPVELTGLYWHFVDIVWVFLFPLLYLAQVRP
jgi:heme/copper-type cytochrome/quinol oxidase subunit 3